MGSIDGGQLGGVNVVGRDVGPPASMRGLQVGVLANVVAGDARGVQLSLGTNLTKGSVEGLQSALLFNRAGSMDGLQLSLVNVAGDLDGVQIGLVNVGRRVRGASIGLVNIADDIDGLPLAPISVTQTGGVHPLAWSGTGGLGNVGVKLATRHTYTLFFGSYHRTYDLQFVGGGFAFGGSFELGAGFRSAIDLCGTYLIAPALSQDPSRESGYHEQLVQPRLRLLLDYRLAADLPVCGRGRARSGARGAGLGPRERERRPRDLCGHRAVICHILFDVGLFDPKPAPELIAREPRDDPRVARAASGDHAAFVALYREHFSGVQRSPSACWVARWPPTTWCMRCFSRCRSRSNASAGRARCTATSCPSRCAARASTCAPPSVGGGSRREPQRRRRPRAPPRPT